MEGIDLGVDSGGEIVVHYYPMMRYTLDVPIVLSSGDSFILDISLSEDVRNHPPYPLIGLEWEPQLTLLNYPKMPIRAISSRHYDFTCGKLFNGDMTKYLIELYVPLKYRENVDTTNIEFRTTPVQLKDLPEAIKTEQDKMEALVKNIAKAVGPTGIFLPALPCTKHVNVSMPEWNTELFKYNGSWKNGVHGGRFHINVGYGFTEYDKLLRAELPAEDRWCRNNKPILLGYSMAGDTYVRRHELI